MGVFVSPVQGSSLPCEVKPSLYPAHLAETLHEHCHQRTQRGPEPPAQGFCEILYSSSISCHSSYLHYPSPHLVIVNVSRSRFCVK